MTNLLGAFPPAFILIFGALLIPFLRGRFRQSFVVFLPLYAFVYIYQLDPATTLTVPFLDYELELIRADAWAKAFGYVFTLSAFATFIYGFYQNRAVEYMSSLMYVGSALGVMFAGDLLTVYIFWELLAITSVNLILARRTEKSRKAGIRYIIVHVFGGLVLLAGIVMHISSTGSLAFTQFTEVNLASSLILIGFLVNAAALPMSSWLPDAYPEATVMGGVILSAYTSKTAVYTLIRAFAGWEVLILVGLAMSVYGIVYALLENDMRRILAYSLISQGGFMVCAVGIGTPLALAGAAAHAFCCIIYFALLWMSAGAVLHQTGKSKCTDLGGLYQAMPWTFAFGTIGALAISAVPFTSGFTSKTIILAAAEQAHLFWPWLILELASAGVVLHAGIKFPYFVFFAKDRGLRPKEANKSMLVAMGFLSFICIYLGCFPEVLYNILPHSELVKSVMPFKFSDIYMHHFPHVVTKFQMLSFSALVFFLCLPWLKRTDTISIDFDWTYRKGWSLFYSGVSRGFEVVNSGVHSLVVGTLTQGLVEFTKNAPAKILVFLLTPIWTIKRVPLKKQAELAKWIHVAISAGSFPIGWIGLGSLVFLAALFFI
ncbi:MAG: multicomponent Na+:H+ antiporter subunit D [Candidatus Marinamargulisbacteria bacterium]|jgi:multicomponent Na+:H+ antiporter subunit D